MVRKKVAKKKTTKKRYSTGKRNTRTLAAVALILNLIILPGLGTLIGGKTREGVLQIILVVVGVVLSIVFIGIPMVIAAWIWGLVSGVRLIQEAK